MGNFDGGPSRLSERPRRIRRSHSLPAASIVRPRRADVDPPGERVAQSLLCEDIDPLEPRVADGRLTTWPPTAWTVHWSRSSMTAGWRQERAQPEVARCPRQWGLCSQTRYPHGYDQYDGCASAVGNAGFPGAGVRSSGFSKAAGETAKSGSSGLREHRESCALKGARMSSHVMTLSSGEGACPGDPDPSPAFRPCDRPNQSGNDNTRTRTLKRGGLRPRPSSCRLSAIG